MNEPGGRQDGRVAVSRPRSLGRVASGVGLQLIIRAMGVLLGVLVASAMAHNLTHEDFGRFTLSLSVVALAATVTDFGVNNTVIRMIAAEPEKRSEIVGGLLVVKGGAGLAAAAVTVVAGVVLADGPAVLLVFAVVAITLTFAPLTSMQNVAQAQLRVGMVNALFALQNLLWTVVALVTLALTADIALLAVAFALSSLAQALITYWSLRRLCRPAFHEWSTFARRILVTAAPLGMGALFISLYYRLDGAIVFSALGARVAADFSAAYRFLDVLQALPIAVMSVVLPLMSMTLVGRVRSAERIRSGAFDLGAVLLLGASALCTVLLWWYAPAVVATVYGLEFVEAVGYVKVLVLAFPLISLGYILGATALVTDRTIAYASVTGVVAVGNVSANLWGVPRFGAGFAAWSTVATEAVVVALLLWISVAKARIRLPIARFGGVGASAGATLAALALLRDAPIVLSTTSACIVFVVSSVLTRVVDIAELKALWRRDVASLA